MKIANRTLLLSICLFACATPPATPPPAWSAGAQVEHPKFPRSRFVAAAGVSTTGQDDADVRAQAAVAAQITAEVKSETSSFQEFTTSAGTRERVTATASVKSDFSRADLIRVVERERSAGTWYAYAVLDRSAADRELGAAQNADLASFMAAAKTAKLARTSGESGVFSTAAAEAGRIRGRLDASFIVRRAVAGRPAQEEAPYLASRNELLAMLEEARARRVVGVLVKAPGGHLNDYAVNAVKRLGLRPDALSCDLRDRRDLTDATQLEVEPEESCQPGSLGERCEVNVKLVAQGCSGGTSGAGTLSAKAMHPDPDKARRSAWDKVTQQAVEAAVRDALKSTIQLGE